MTTARDLIQGALERIQVYAPGEQASNPDFARGLSELNSMLDSWSNENLTCYSILQQTGTIIPGVTQYTIGPGGTFNMIRPLRIDSSPGAVYLIDNNGDKYLLDVREQFDFNMISEPNVNSDLPSILFYDPQFPLGIINIYPAPNQSFPLYFDSYLQMADLGSLSAVLSLPPGYEKAIRDNLAIEISPYFPTAVVTDKLENSARKSKANVKRTNIRLNISSYDQAIVAKPRGTWDIYSNSYNR